jgi:large subunit ribosomal protein L9
MEVILLEKLHRLGDLGDKVNVKPGYGRNYLIPQKKAVPATADNIAEFEEKRAEFERVQSEEITLAEARKEKLSAVEITITANAGAEGKLFGSVGGAEIAGAVSETGNEVSKSEIRLPDGPLREVGEYDVAIYLHADLSVSVRVHIVASEGEQNT